MTSNTTGLARLAYSAQCRDRISYQVATGERDVIITFNGRPIRLLTLIDADELHDDQRGWFLWSVGDQSGRKRPAAQSDGLAVRAGKLVVPITGESGDERVAAADAPLSVALGSALRRLYARIATDSANGTGPFSPGGIAGPARVGDDVSASMSKNGRIAPHIRH